MHKRFFASILATALLFLGAGCANSSESSTQPETASIYSIRVVKSPQFTETKTGTGIQEKADLKTLLEHLNIPFKIAMQNGKEIFIEFDSVIGTLSKEWNIYINNTIPTYAAINDIEVHASDEIELRYEERK